MTIMNTRICYQQSVTSGQPMPLTKENWGQLIDSPEVKNICNRIAALDPTADDYNDRKQALKRRLPIIIPHAQSFKNGKRISADAVPSGLAMLDVDHVEDPRSWFDAIDKQLLSDNRIYLVAITASGKGLRVIGERLEHEPIEAAQLRIANALGIQEFDAVTKDLARASYVVPRDYILWIYESGLLEMPEQALSFEPEIQRLALPPHEPSSISPESNSGDVLQYRGIPYSAIVQQLMLSIGAADGAEQGERNTVYFTLANYMRYICDFNVDLLLQVLPTFGLSEPERRQVIASAIGTSSHRFRYRPSAQVTDSNRAPIGNRHLREGSASGRTITTGEIHRASSAGTTAFAQTGLPQTSRRLSSCNGHRFVTDSWHARHTHPFRVPRPSGTIAFVLLMYHRSCRQW